MIKALAALVLLLRLTTPAIAQDMTGATASLEAPAGVNAGDAGASFEFYVYNGSPDTEWTTAVVFTFPPCFTVTGGTYDDGGLGWVFTFAAAGNVASFADGDAGYGEIYDGDGGYFHVTVDVGGDCPLGPAAIHWMQQGDNWGGLPHVAEGDMDFMIGGTATESSTWSSLKALFE